MLYLTGVPIGNPGDITLRALEILKSCEILLCEDRKSASRMFHAWQIPFPGPNSYLVNEHTTGEELLEIFQLIQGGKRAVLISDAGMPILCDPGMELVQMVRKANIPVEVIPGVTALTTAIALSGKGGHGFVFHGYPPRETGERERFFKQLAKTRGAQIFYETPYRLKKVLQELAKCLPDTKRVFIGAGLTTDNQIMRDCKPGELSRAADSFSKLPPVFIVYDEK